MKGGKFSVKRRGFKKLAEDFLETLMDGIEISSRRLVTHFKEEHEIKVTPREAAHILNKCNNAEVRILTEPERWKEGIRNKWKVKKG